MKKEIREVGVGIAVVSWNNETIISTCLESIRSQTYKKITTIVLDNASADTTAQIVRRDYPWVDLIQSKENTGFSKGNNTIIKQFMAAEDIDYVVLLNSDATLDPEWVDKLVEFARSHKRLGAAQGLTLDFFDHSMVDSTHIYINHKGQAIQAGYRQPRSSIPGQPKRVFGVNAAACMISKDFLRQQPFDYVFDEDFFMYLEDVDFAARTFVMGWENYFVPSALAYHMGSASSGKNPGFSVYMVNRNRIAMLIKNLPTTTLFRLLPGMLVGDAKELYRIARGKNYLVMRKFIMGRIKGVFLMPKYFKKARLVSKSRKIDNATLWKFMRNGMEDI